jgi:hypothetical protein
MVVGGDVGAWWVSCYRGEMPPLFVTFVDFLVVRSCNDDWRELTNSGAIIRDLGAINL